MRGKGAAQTTRVCLCVRLNATINRSSLVVDWWHGVTVGKKLKYNDRANDTSLNENGLIIHRESARVCVCTFFIIITILLHCTLGSYGTPPCKRSSRWLENGSSPKSSVELAGNRFASRVGQTVRQDDREKLTGRCLAIGRGSHCNERIQSVLSPLPWWASLRVPPWRGWRPRTSGAHGRCCCTSRFGGSGPSFVTLPVRGRALFGTGWCQRWRGV